MKVLFQLQDPATLTTSDTHWKFVREVHNFIHNLYKVKAVGIAPEQSFPNRVLLEIVE